MDDSLDNSFGPVLFPGDVGQILVQPDKQILVAGGEDYWTILERLNADGSVDTSFAVNGAIDPLSIKALNLEASGKIMLLTGYWPITARRLNSDGSLDTSFPGVQLRISPTPSARSSSPRR